MDRRFFLKSGCGLCTVGIVGAVAFLQSCKKDNASPDPQGPDVNFTLDLTQSANASLNTSGGSLSTHGVVVANTGSTFIAIAEQCTHQNCNIGYHSNTNNFVCPCHGGTYDVNGNVVSGPPPSPLKVYSVVKNGDVLTVSG
ncbi:MAG: Rieske (2Fe-2S) protein [Bacteroidota bacterium]